jgi:hypothetical protein
MTYVITLWLSPPIKELIISATQPKIITQLRLQRSARIPDGTSNSGVTAAYAAAITPTDAASKPICVMNSFSIGTHKSSPCNATPICSGRSRRASVRGVVATDVITIRPCSVGARGQAPPEAVHATG